VGYGIDFLQGLNTMKRYWLLFSQTVTVLLAVWFVLVTLKPEWLNHRPSLSSLGLQTALEDHASASMGVTAPGSFSAAAKKAAPAVVSINTTKNPEKSPTPLDPWFKHFFGEPEDNSAQVGLGSGVIVSDQGYILTNYHVVEEADEIEVSLNDGRKAQAKVIGVDPDSDLAVLKIKLERLPVIVIGNSDGLQVGDQVLAIGNPFGVGQTVTSGIVSALGRNQLGLNTFENFIQTDAAINPGNSGGALVDVYGNLMGINTAIFSRSGGSLGIGFAIPVSTAQQVLEGIIKEGQVTRGWIGVEPNELSPELMQTFGLKDPNLKGVAVTGVLQNAPAAKAGLKPGDVIVMVGNKRVAHVAELLSAVAGLKPNQSVPFKIKRKDQDLTVTLTPAQRPKLKPQGARGQPGQREEAP
jgi:serine protease DegQ